MKTSWTRTRERLTIIWTSWTQISRKRRWSFRVYRRISPKRLLSRKQRVESKSRSEELLWSVIVCWMISLNGSCQVQFIEFVGVHAAGWGLSPWNGPQFSSSVQSVKDVFNDRLHIEHGVFTPEIVSFYLHWWVLHCYVERNEKIKRRKENRPFQPMDLIIPFPTSRSLLNQSRSVRYGFFSGF